MVQFTPVNLSQSTIRKICFHTGKIVSKKPFLYGLIRPAANISLEKIRLVIAQRTFINDIVLRITGKDLRTIAVSTEK